MGDSIVSFASSLILSRIPRISTVVFELVKVEAKKIADNNPESYRAQQVGYVSLDVMPESFSSGLRTRNTITQTNKIFVQKFTPMPEVIRISGTFGDQESALSILGVNLTLDGWGRLRQFEEDIVKKSMSFDTDMVYAVNYYDFLFQRFGSIDITSFNLTASAQENTNLVRYQLEFQIIGKLVDVEPGSALTNIMIAQILADNATNFTELGLVLGASTLLTLIDSVDSIIDSSLDFLGSKLSTQSITSGLKPVKDLQGSNG